MCLYIYYNLVSITRAQYYTFVVGFQFLPQLFHLRVPLTLLLLLPFQRESAEVSGFRILVLLVYQFADQGILIVIRDADLGAYHHHEIRHSLAVIYQHGFQRSVQHADPKRTEFTTVLK